MLFGNKHLYLHMLSNKAKQLKNNKMQNLNQVTSKAMQIELSIMQAKANESQFAKKAKAAKRDYSAIIAIAILSIIPVAIYLFNIGK